MTDPDNKKDLRRQKLAEKNFKNDHLSDEDRFVSKSKKQHKRKIQDIRAEELWEDWEDEVH